MKPTKKNRYRLVIDLKKTDIASFNKQERKPKFTVAPPPRDPIPQNDLRSKRTKKLIVLDPGHGGIDPGAPGARGVPEKTVALSAARAIKKYLESTGRYQVRLTRNSDVFLSLRQRVRFAHKHQADLFISLHADSFRDKSIRGATVYTLSEKASDREAAALAAKENKSDIIAGVDLEAESNDVQKILIDLMQRETMNHSAQFASALVPELKKAVHVRKYAHRSAGFVVLKGLDIPSVLLEMGYISNRTDAKLLLQRETQQKISRAIAVAADRYFQNNFAEY